MLVVELSYRGQVSSSTSTLFSFKPYPFGLFLSQSCMILAYTTCTNYICIQLYCPVWTTQSKVDPPRYLHQICLAKSHKKYKLVAKTVFLHKKKCVTNVKNYPETFLFYLISLSSIFKRIVCCSYIQL